jgi:hypothetical protein
MFTYILHGSKGMLYFKGESMVDLTSGGKLYMNSLLNLLSKLGRKNIHYKLNKIRDGIMIEISVPGERWEIEFFEDNHVEIEKFKSDGQIFDNSELKCLFEKFSD